MYEKIFHGKTKTFFFNSYFEFIGLGKVQYIFRFRLKALSLML